MGLLRHVIASTLLWSLLAGTAVAQTTDLSGFVRDSSRAVLPGVEVTLLQDGKPIRTVVTDQTGRYVFTAIPPGRFTLRATLAGFRTKDSEVTVTSQQAVSVDLTLNTGGGLSGTSGEGRSGWGKVGDFLGWLGHATASIFVPTSVPPPAPPPPADGDRLAWNTWAQTDPSIAVVAPIDSLQADQDYYISVDLSGVLLQRFGSPASLALNKTLATNTDSSAVLQIYAVFDQRFFEPLEDPVRTLTVDLNKLRGFTKSTDPTLNQLASGRASFGRVQFQVHTRQQVSGAASVGFSVWIQNRVPIDDFEHTFCVALTTCEQSTRTNSRLMGADSLRVALQRELITLPDGALHFMEIGPSVVGIFRCNTCGWPEHQYASWVLGQSASQLTSYILNTIRTDMQAAGVKDDALLRYAGNLYERLFPSAQKAALKPFEEFVERHLRQASTSNPPSLFVRFLPRNNALQFPIPLGLVARSIGDRSEYLGSHFRIESPLDAQDYSTNQACIDKWVAFAPDENEATQANLAALYTPASRWLSTFKESSTPTPSSSREPLLFSRPGRFAEWLRAGTSSNADGDALLVLSHHSMDRLYFRDGDAVEATDVRRSFRTPSVVILGACGSASPGAMEFVRRFNERGTSVAIVTATNVDAAMTGYYANALLDSLNKSRDQPIGLAHLAAVKEVASTIDPSTKDLTLDGKPVPPRTFGARALQFMLIGNGSVRVCAPSPPPQ